jgi:hypothetical protein
MVSPSHGAYSLFKSSIVKDHDVLFRFLSKEIDQEEEEEEEI